MENILVDFTRWCHEFQNPKTRSSSEQQLIRFRQQQNVLPVCYFIMKNSKDPQVLFHLASALKEVIVREYDTYDKNLMKEFQNDVLIFNHASLPKYVSDQFFQVYAISMKRGWLDMSPQEREEPFQKAIQLLNGGEQSQRKFAFFIFSAFLDEFSSDKASSVGLPVSFHYETRRIFQDAFLKNIFDLGLSIMLQASQTHDIELLKSNLNMTDKIFGWQFTSLEKDVFTSASTEDLEDEGLFKLNGFPLDWILILGKQETIQSFFLVYQLFREDPIYSQKARATLLYLASIPSYLQSKASSYQELAISFCASFTKNTLKMVSDFIQSLNTRSSAGSFVDSRQDELAALAHLIKVIMSSFPVHNLLPHAFFKEFLEVVNQITFTALQNMIQADELEASGVMEIIDDLMNAWATLSEKLTSDPNSMTMAPILSSLSSNLFAQYLTCRLTLSSKSDTDEYMDETNFKDREVYEDQLVNICALGRIAAVENLSKLLATLNELASNLISVIEQKRIDMEAHAMILNEQLNWILLLLGHLLADKANGEIPMVPTMLKQITIFELQKQLLDFLFKISRAIAKTKGSSAIMLCSPLLSETLVWFFTRWSQTYLLSNVDDYDAESQPLIRSMCLISTQDTLGLHFFNNIIGILQQFYGLWKSDSDVLEQMFSSLIVFSKSRITHGYLLQSSEFHIFIDHILADIMNIPPKVHLLVIQTVAYFAVGSSDNETRLYLFHKLDETIQHRLDAVVNNPVFTKKAQDEVVSSQVLNVLEMFEGIVTSLDANNIQIIFSICAKRFELLKDLLQVYQSHWEVPNAIIRLYAQITRYMSLEELPSDQQTMLVHSSLNIVKKFSSIKRGVVKKKSIHSNDDTDEDVVYDFLLLMDVPLNMMDTSLQGMNTFRLKTSNSEVQYQAQMIAELAFCTLEELFSLLSKEFLEVDRVRSKLLLFAKKCTEYFPEKVKKLSPNLLQGMNDTIIYGINCNSSDICKEALNALTYLSTYQYQLMVSVGVREDDPVNTILAQGMDSVLQLAIFKNVDSQVLHDLSTCLFMFILLFRAKFESSMQHLIQHHSAQALYSSRLIEGIQKILKTMNEIVASHSAESWIQVSHPSDKSVARSMVKFQNVLFKVLFDFRGLLLVK